jgi:hypothetical protein
MLSKSSWAHMRAGFAVVSLAILTFYGGTSANADYIVEKGRDIDLCEKYKDNLNVGNPKSAYQTERPISSSFPDFKSAEWYRFPDGTSLSADAIVEFFWKRDVNPVQYIQDTQYASWQGSKQQIQAAKRSYINRIGSEEDGFDQSVSFKFAEVDLDNDGIPERILQFKPDPYSSLLLILRPDLSEIDKDKSRLVLRHAPWGTKSSIAFRKAQGARSLEPIEDALHGAYYGIFTFRGKTYFDLWWFSDAHMARLPRQSANQWRLRVYEGNASVAKEVCVIRIDSR